MTANTIQVCILAAVLSTAGSGLAIAHSKYDGTWNLIIVTEYGACEQYNVPVQIIDGQVTFPNLNKSSGSVSSKGDVRVFVSAMGKSASGSGKLKLNAGSGRWTGQSGEDRCSGTWTAEKQGAM